MGSVDIEKAKALALAQANALAGQQSGKHYAFDGSKIPGYDPATGNMQPGIGEDVAKAVPSYFARGTANLAGLPGTIGDALDRGGEWLMRKGYQTVTGSEPSHQGGAVERFFAGPDPEVMKKLGYESGVPGSPLSGAKLTEHMASASGGATDYQAKTMPGQFAGAISEFVPSALAFGPASAAGLVKNAVIPAVSSEAAGQVAHKYAPGLEPYARAAGAILGGYAGSKLPLGETSTTLPTAAEIKKNAGYAELKEPMKAAKINQETYGAIVNDLKAVAEDFGVVPELHGGVETVLLRHAQKAEQGGASLYDLEIMRRSLQNVGKNPLNPSAGELSRQLVDKLDESVGNISSANAIPAEGAAADETIKALEDARSIYRTGSKAAIVEKAMEKAQNAASGGENGLRIQFRKILDNEKLARQFTPTEKLAIQQVANGTFKGNLLRLVGGFGVPVDNARNFLGSVVGGGVGGTIGSYVAGPAGAAIGGPLLMGVGTAAKIGSNAITKNNALLAEALVKAGPAASDAFAEALQASQVAGKEGILRALLQAQSAVQIPSAKSPARR